MWSSREAAARPIPRGIEFPTPGTITLSSLAGFSHESTELKPVDPFLSNPTEDRDYPLATDLKPLLTTLRPLIGQLFELGSAVSTLFLIKDNWVMTARHCLNHSRLRNLSVQFGGGDFDEDRAIPVTAIIEDGAANKRDYVILQLATPVKGIEPLRVNTEASSWNSPPTSLLFIGYNTEGILHFSAFSNFDSTAKLWQPGIASYQGTGACFSGSPYFDLQGRVCGVHSRASEYHKKATYLGDICKKKPDSCLVTPTADREIFIDSDMDTYRPAFTLAAPYEFNERDPLDIQWEAKSGFSTTGGPSNQSTHLVQNAIKRELVRLRSTGKMLTEVQHRFLVMKDYNLKGNKIDIAHNIAISAMREALTYKMNHPLKTGTEKAAELKAAEAFADAIASLDDEKSEEPSSLTHIKRPRSHHPIPVPHPAASIPSCNSSRVKHALLAFLQQLRTAQAKGITTQTTADELSGQLKELLQLLNPCWKNLMPGHAAINRHIQNNRDPHLTIKRSAAGSHEVEYEETETSKAIARAALAFLGEHIPPLKTDLATGKVASSSVNSGNDPANGYCLLPPT